ncbi:MAG: hypothetical protein JWP52_4003 [Rhizobacter sp.]|nr:hypothetical protein [Rhizobacter sp.]
MATRAPGRRPSSRGASRDETPAPKPRGSGWRRLAITVVTVLAIAVAALASVVWGLKSETGTAWLLSWLPKVRVSEPRGALLGDFSAKQVEVALAPGAGGATSRVVVTGLSWKGLDWSVLPGNRQWARLHLQSLAIDRIDAELAPSANASSEPLKRPTSLALPLMFQLDALRIGEIHAGALGDKPLRELTARLSMGLDSGATDRIDSLSVMWDRVRLKGNARIGTRAPFPVVAQLDAQQSGVDEVASAASAAAGAGAASGAASATPSAAPSTPASSAGAARDTTGAASTTPSPATSPLADWVAAVRIEGPLDRLDVQATLRASGIATNPVATASAAPAAPTRNTQPSPRRSRRSTPAVPPPAAPPAPPPIPQTFDARATVTPFEAWPLAALNASTQALDLSALVPGAPATSLSGSAVANTAGLDRAADVTLQLRNDLPGRWDQARLPLRVMQLVARGRPDTPNAVTLESFDLELGNDKRAGGRVQGTGQWTPQRWSFDTTLAAVEPIELDARAAPMRISGPLSVQGTQTSGGIGATLFDLKTDLQGTLKDLAAARQLRLQMDASGTAQRIEVKQATLSSGTASVNLTGSASHASSEAPWRVAGKADVARLDPRTFWPGAVGSAWQQGPHRINAKADFDVLLPASSPAPAPVPATRGAGRASPQSASPLAALSTLRGQASATLADTVLAGVPLSGTFALRGTEPKAPLSATADLDVAGNTVKAAGRIDRNASGQADHWELQAQAGQLQKLTPLMKLLQPSAAAARLAGTLEGNAVLDGRWPAITTTGSAKASQLAAAGLTLARGDASWRIGTAPDAPTELQLSLAQAGVGTQTAEAVEARLQGTARAHTLAVNATVNALPPVWADTLQSAVDASRTTTAASSGVSAAPSGRTPPASPIAPTLRAGEQPRTQLTLQASGGVIGNVLAPNAGPLGWKGTVQRLEAGSTAEGMPAWVRVENVSLAAQANGDQPVDLSVSAGRAQVLGAAVRWGDLRYRGGDAPQLDLQAELEPLAVAPLLARLQPAFGWGGDLKVGASINVRSSPQLTAQIELARRSGDLTVTDEAGTQSLGLSDVRLTADAKGGAWRITETLNGANLGSVSGVQTVQTSPQALWPTPDSPLRGTLTAKVDNLSTWGAWVPTGWRLMGSVTTTAAITGRFGAPEYTGSVNGKNLAVRNVLEGVNITDGDVAIALQGTTARIERFTAKAGNGTLRLEGGATLGDAPKAQLRLIAERFQLLGRVDRRVVASGQADLALEAASIKLDGRFGVDEGLIDFSRSDAPSLAADVTVVRADAPPLPADPEPTRARAVALNLQIDLGQKLRLKGRGIDTGLRGDLKLTSPGGKLALNGVISTADGTYAAYGQKLTIDRGQITFSGAIENPRLDIEATRPNTDIRVGVAVTGTALNPRIRLFSDPDTTDTAKLSWLVLGRAPDGLGRSDTALLQSAAMALLAGDGESKTDQITKSLGLDELSFRQGEGGDAAGTVLALGKQISRRWYVGYERGLNATTGSFQLIYRIAQRFTLRAQSGLDNSLDAIWVWRWK